MKDLSDEDLVYLYTQSNLSEYFDELYKRYYTQIKNKCFLFTKDQESAADMTQEVFIKLLLKLSTFQGKSKFSTWLYTVTSHYCLDQLRTQGINHQLVAEVNWQELSDNIPSIDHNQPDELAWQIKKCWWQLNTEERHLLTLKYLKGKSIKEIASTLQVTLPTIKMRLKRSRDRLRNYCMANYQFTEDRRLQNVKR